MKTLYKNNRLVILFILLISLVTLSSCRVRVEADTQSIPPGQMKKITGSKSAADYAPGHNK